MLTDSELQMHYPNNYVQINRIYFVIIFALSCKSKLYILSMFFYILTPFFVRTFL